MYRITRLYQMFDTEANSVSGPIIAANRDAPAIRMFTQVLGDPKTLPGEYPHHFQLKLIGSQIEDTGEITPENPPQIIATGAQWKEQQDRLKAQER